MFVRLAFAVAAHLDSDILIADEVLAVGDADFQKRALGKMQELSTGEGRTILFVSHNMPSVKKLCNQGIWLEKGIIRETSDDISKLASEYLQDNIKNITSSVWKNSGTIQDDFFTPLSLCLEDEDGNTVESDISTDKNYKIKLIFEVKELSSNLNIYFIFSLTDGMTLFKTSPFDYIHNFKLSTGINTLYCSIPSNLLSINDYHVSLGSEIGNYKIITNPYADNEDPSKAMIVIKVKSKKTINPFGLTQSALSPKLIWTEK
jgi:lipopolysaccharide transport system ATP-binding protein